MRGRDGARMLLGMLVAAVLLFASLAVSDARFVALDLPGSQLTALSADGAAAAGSLSGDRNGGFRWQAGRGARTLPDAISVQAISPDGRYVAGSSLDGDQIEVASWWGADGGAHRLDGAARILGLGRAPTAAYAIGNDLRLDGATLDRATHFRWAPGHEPRRDEGAHELASLPACSGQRAPVDPPPGLVAPLRFVAASADGSVWIGNTGSGAQRRAVVWPGAGPVQPLDAYLRSRGVPVPEGWTLVAATAIDPPARHIGGFGLHDGHFDSFIAALPANDAVACTARTTTGPRSTARQPSRNLKP